MPSGRGNHAPQGGNNAGGERLIQAKRIANGKDLLAHLKIGAGSDFDGRKFVLRRANLNHGQIIVRRNAHQRGVITGMIRQRDRGRGLGLNHRRHHVEIRHDVPGIIPDKARACPLRDFLHISIPELHARGRGDENNRWAGLFKQINRRLFIPCQIPARRHRPRIERRRPMVHEESPDQQRADADQQEDDQR